CVKCFEVLCLDNIVHEQNLGLNSILKVKCTKCDIITIVPTSKTHRTGDNKSNHSDINTGIVLGAVHAGYGCTGLNKILACANIPTISPQLFKRYEREVGPAIEEAAKESCKRAAKEEQQLVNENIDKLCELFFPLPRPQKIVEEIYPHHAKLKSSIVDLDENNNTTYDSAVGEVVNIIVSYDMGWSKRGNGKSYDSLNGYGTIIGFLSGKILDYADKIRKCKFCDLGRKKEDHDCRKNFVGSAKAMEASAGADLVNNSTVLKETNLEARVLIGDEDSCTIAAVRRGNPKKFLNFYALAQNVGDSKNLAKAIRNIPNHLYDNHENCGSWCCRRSGSGEQTILLTNLTLFDQLSAVCEKYAASANKFSIPASSQANESFNNIMAHKSPKNICYSKSESSSYRLASSVCTKNDGDSCVVEIRKKLKLSPGLHTSLYAEQSDNKRKKRAIDAKLPVAKKRRVLVTQEREKLRKKNENSEGVQYKSKCGLSQDGEDFEAFDESQIKGPDIKMSPETCNLVFFDLETSGFRKSDEILQIAASCNGRKFSVYINPTKIIDDKASAHTGLKNINGDLYFHTKKVESLPLKKLSRVFNVFKNVT
ncbi:uncharacterized protein LOC141534112, partial [Cotesia typhae]|uniref:uncharacterized protein LOC141534112 n=1 Tax=Cotesia typhae TaxID=2053667 RepID=UPI003D695DA0